MVVTFKFWVRVEQQMKKKIRMLGKRVKGIGRCAYITLKRSKPILYLAVCAGTTGHLATLATMVAAVEQAEFPLVAHHALGHLQ
jgi:hypothetical protein